MIKAIVLRGPAGVGKSTIGSLLRQKLNDDWACLDVDTFKHVISQASSDFRTTMAHEVANYFLEKLIQNEVKVIVEEIFKEDYLGAVLRLFETGSYEVLTVFLTAPADTLVHRDATRSKNKGEAIIRRLSYEVSSLGETLEIDTSVHTAEESVDVIITAINKLNLTL